MQYGNCSGSRVTRGIEDGTPTEVIPGRSAAATLEPSIPVLVIACNRPDYIVQTLDSLLRSAICTFIHIIYIHIHQYINTNMQKYVHTDKKLHVHAYLHKFVHTFIIQIEVVEYYTHTYIHVQMVAGTDRLQGYSLSLSARTVAISPQHRLLPNMVVE